MVPTCQYFFYNFRVKSKKRGKYNRGKVIIIWLFSRKNEKNPRVRTEHNWTDPLLISALQTAHIFDDGYIRTYSSVGTTYVHRLRVPHWSAWAINNTIQYQKYRFSILRRPMLHREKIIIWMPGVWNVRTLYSPEPGKGGGMLATFPSISDTDQLLFILKFSNQKYHYTSPICWTA